MIRCASADCSRAGPRSRSTIAVEFARHEPALGDQRQRGRSAAHRHRRPAPNLGDGRTRRQGRAVLARDPDPARAIRWAPPQGPGTNVAQAYARFARDYREGTRYCPTFEDAVTRHRMLNAIETAAATGQPRRLASRLQSTARTTSTPKPSTASLRPGRSTSKSQASFAT